MLYRILTENRNKEQVIQLVREKFEGFTVYEGIEVWQGTKEANLTIEIETFSNQCRLTVMKLADTIKEYNKQEAVLVQVIESKAYLC